MRLSTDFVYELPFYRSQDGVAGHALGGWQVSSYLTFQSGSPFSPLNGTDPAGALADIDGLVGNSIRPNFGTALDVTHMSVEELLAAGAAPCSARSRLRSGSAMSDATSCAATASPKLI